MRTTVTLKASTYHRAIGNGRRLCTHHILVYNMSTAKEKLGLILGHRRSLNLRLIVLSAILRFELLNVCVIQPGSRRQVHVQGPQSHRTQDPLVFHIKYEHSQSEIANMGSSWLCWKCGDRGFTRQIPNPYEFDLKFFQNG